MRFSRIIAVTLYFVVAFAQNTLFVKVGENGYPTFDPPVVLANTGDIVVFQFLAKNHTVTQSTFATPCQKMTTPNVGVDSGFQPVYGGAAVIPQWSITVTNTSVPLWFYCRQANHCQGGMVFAINPTAEMSFATFLANAVASGGGASPSESSPVRATSSASSLMDLSNDALKLYRGNTATIATFLGLFAMLVLQMCLASLIMVSAFGVD